MTVPVITGVLRVGTLLLPVNPPMVLAIAAGGTILLIGSALAYKLATDGKNAKFSVNGLFDFEANFGN